MKVPGLLHALKRLPRASLPAFMAVAVGFGLVPLFLEGAGREPMLAPNPQVRSPGPDARQPLIDRAAALRREGDYEGAAAIYVSLASQAGAAAGLALAAAEAYLAAGDYQRTIQLADLAARQEPGASQGQFLRAEALAKLGAASEAVEALEAYPAAGPLAGYAAFRAAELRAAARDEVGARILYERALSSPMAAPWKIAAAHRTGASFAEAGAAEPGVPWLRRAAAEAGELEGVKPPTWFDGSLAKLSLRDRRASILLDLGDAQRASGQVEDSAGTYAEIVARYPSSSEARAALNRLAAIGAHDAVSGHQRGVVLYHAGEPRQAIDVLQSFLATEVADGVAAEARFYGGLARRDAGDREGARSTLVRMAEAHPTSPRAPEALWHAARLTESVATRSEAVEAYLAVWRSFPSDEHAGRALLRAGWLQLRGGDATEARATWERLGRLHPEARHRAQGLFWFGRGLLGLGEVEAGSTALSEAAKLAPQTFEGIRARDLVEGGLGADPLIRNRARILSSPPQDAGECAQWIEGWSGQARSEAEGLPQLARIDALVAAGLRSEALAESLDLVAGLADRPQALYGFARGLQDRGLYPVAIHAGTRLAVASQSGGVDQAPKCAQKLVFPLAYRDLVQAAASRYDLDPYVLLALLRQESWFGERAISSAQARGLSQVIPSTAAEIARELGRTDFAIDDLYRPRESISFGAWYLSRQMAALGRRPLLALAAYNGGPGNARRWSQEDTAIDPDDFVEAIDYPETRTYVRSIYESYTRYRGLYE